MLNWQELVQAPQKLFATTEAEAHMCNQGVIDIIAKIDEVGTTTHGEWYGDLCNNIPTLEKWYHHVGAKASNDKTMQGVMDGTTPSAVVDSSTTSNVGKYGNGLYFKRGTVTHNLQGFNRARDTGHQDHNYGARTARTSAHIQHGPWHRNRLARKDE